MQVVKQFRELGANVPQRWMTVEVELSCTLSTGQQVSNFRPAGQPRSCSVIRFRLRRRQPENKSSRKLFTSFHETKEM